MRIPDRSVLRIVGAKAANFLSALCTQNICNLGGNGDFAFLLNSKGRVLFDVRVWKDSLGLLVDVHSQMIDSLERHLKSFDLRREFQFKRMKDQCVQTNENAPFSYSIASSQLAPFPGWTWERVVRRGLPQVPTDLQSGVSFPFDGCADLIGAVDWNKGCYLGQELVARASRLGIVRKRLFPFEAESAELQVNQPVFDSEGLEVGKIASVYPRDCVQKDQASNSTLVCGFALLSTANPNPNVQSLRIHNPLNASITLKNIDNQ